MSSPSKVIRCQSLRRSNIDRVAVSAPLRSRLRLLPVILHFHVAAAVAITALILNSRGFASVESRFASLENRFTSLENRMIALENRIRTDLQEFYRILTDHDRRIQRLEDNK